MQHINRRNFLVGAGAAAVAGVAAAPARAGVITDLTTDIVVATRFASAGIPIRSFSVPSTSMMPTIPLGNVILADLRLTGGMPKRGDIVVFNRPDGVVYLKRVMALPGDRIAFANWIPIVNNSAAEWSKLDPITVHTDTGPVTYPIVEERLPGISPYRIAMLANNGVEELATIPERYVGPDEIYVVGDNRCNSNDSRVPGWETTHVDDMLGRAVYRLRPDAGWLVSKETVAGYPS